MSRSVFCVVRLKGFSHNFGAARHVEKLPSSHAGLRSERTVERAQPVIAIEPVGGATDFGAVADVRRLWRVIPDKFAVRVDILRPGSRRHQCDQRRSYHRSHIRPSHSEATVAPASTPVTPMARRAS